MILSYGGIAVLGTAIYGFLFRQGAERGTHLTKIGIGARSIKEFQNKKCGVGGLPHVGVNIISYCGNISEAYVGVHKLFLFAAMTLVNPLTIIKTILVYRLQHINYAEPMNGIPKGLCSFGGVQRQRLWSLFTVFTEQRNNTEALRKRERPLMGRRDAAPYISGG